MYWDWSNYPAGTLPPLLHEAIRDISTKIQAKPPSGLEHVKVYLENLIAGKMLESRGIVYDSELTVIMSWLDGSCPSPFPRDELAKLLVRTARHPGLAPFTLTASYIYANLIPAVLEYILDLARRDQVKIYEDISPEELLWGESLAQGTSGRVYRGEWRHQPVAIKKFIVADPPVVRNELTLISLLRNPNLVDCYGGFAGEGTALFVTELLDCNLFELLRTKPTLDFAVKIKLAIGIQFNEILLLHFLLAKSLIQSEDIAEGMAFLHTRNIVHRDLKSVNVLIQLGSIDLSAKVCDFGLSRVLDDNGRMTGNIGTVAWIAPEVFQSKRYSEKCDVYSFGVILYELLTHSTPFKEIASFRIPAAVVKGKRPTLPADALNAPKTYLTLMKRCWNQNPNKRPSFPEILSALTTLLPNVPPAPIPSGSTDVTEETSFDSEDGRTNSNPSSVYSHQDVEDQVFSEFKADWRSKHGNYNKDPLINEMTLLRCLRARRQDAKAARRWYKYLNKGKPILINLVKQHLLKKLIYYPMGAVDIEGKPILCFNITMYFVDKFPVIEFIRTAVYALERIVEKHEDVNHGITILCSAKEFTMANLSWKATSAFFETLNTTFPVVVRKIILVDPPSWMPKVLVLVNPILGKLTSKIIFVSRDEINRYITNENLVSDLGGSLDFGITNDSAVLAID